MGFNKRYLNEKILRTVLSEGGFQDLIDFVRKPDSLIIEDDFSRKVSDIILETEDKYILEKLLQIL
jgi:hypothetical protein